ncbi:MAG: BrnT family toxin [Blastocatellia bacterium]
MDVGYVWDETKYQTVVKEHNVKFYEVVAAFEDPDGFEEASLIEHENRWLWVGKTLWDRLLIIVFTDQDLPLYRIITAYDANERWVEEYYARQR